MKEKTVILKVNESDVDEAHFIIAGICAVMMETCEMTEKQVASKLRNQYFATKKVLEMVVEKGAACVCDKGKNEVANDIVSIMMGINLTAEELGYHIDDERVQAVHQKKWSA